MTQILSTSLAEALESFSAQLSLSWSSATVSGYTFDVRMFLEWLAARKVKRLANIKPEHIISYLGTCKQAGKADSSISRYFNSIRAFCKHLRKHKLIAEDITQDITAPSFKNKCPRIPTKEEMLRIVGQPDVTKEHGCRDRAILELLYSSGLRASELCDLSVKDVGDGQVRVECGKGAKTRTVPITLHAQEAIRAYLTTWRANAQEDEYLFITKYGKQLTRQYLSVLVGDYSRGAGVEGVTTHTLRHACATHLLDKGADLRLIQEVLGHSTIASTQRYTHLSSENMKSMFNQFHPR